jgi:imidazole glycerol-phosphate synthase subunit HisH
LKTAVTVIDYGMGNLHSVCHAFEHIGCEVLLTASPQDVARAERLVLPGVGAFKDGMAELDKRGLVGAIRDYAASGRPVLGICLGMQMLLESSDEFGDHEGLGLINGVVRVVPKTGANDVTHKIPHIGWNRLLPCSGAWDRTILNGIAQGTEVYFVHSYTAHPADEALRLADADYDGCRISAAVRKDRVYGCQFHPEKSGPAGLQMLRNFVEVA